MRQRNAPGPCRQTPAEPIRAGELWPIALLNTRLGWGARARAAAIRRGLPVYRFGRWAYIATDDLMTFLTRRPDSQSSGESSENPGKGPDPRADVAPDVATEGPVT